MTDDLEVKRLRYKRLRDTLSPKRRAEWLEIENQYTHPDDLFSKYRTPDQWLCELQNYIAKTEFLDAYTAWINYRGLNPNFWGNNFNPFLNIEGYTWSLPLSEKTQLFRKQLQSDISIEASFDDWFQNRD